MAIPTYTREQLITLVNQYLVPNSNILATEHNEIETAIVNAIYGQIGDIKEIACDINYINTNFDMNGLTPGLGKSTGERYGWAICNGNNGTIDKRGRVGVGYNPADVDFSTLGYTSGTKTVTLQESQMPIHNHGYTGVVGNGHPDGSGDSTTTGSGNSYPRQSQLLNKGGGQAHNNMQPYIVTLFIQRVVV